MVSNFSKSISDPIYGFVDISNSLIRRIIDEPCFQRLRRIRQMGMSSLVFPGAHHTRFEHAIGSMHLMKKAISVLRSKGIEISEKEHQGLLVAILLHDVGHGPYSHALEGCLMKYSHEEISLKYMQMLDAKYNGALDTAIDIFKGKHPKKFLNQLVSGQLDMDRLDYLHRDSFFVAVPEGRINTERIISMLYVVDGELLIEEKGIYPVEGFLMARRFMYWQVYFHKVSLVTEQLLSRIFRRVREIYPVGRLPNSSSSINYFIDNQIENIDKKVLETFSTLDDYDVMSAVKYWQYSNDSILASLSNMLIDRKPLSIQIYKNPLDVDCLERKRQELVTKGVDADAANYYVFAGSISNQAYISASGSIKVLMSSGEVRDIAEVSDHFSLKALSEPVKKYYITTLRNVHYNKKT